MNIEPPDPESMLDDLFPLWDELFADASYAHERVKMIQHKLKLIPPSSRDPNRDVLLKELEAALLKAKEVAIRITQFCANRERLQPDE